MNTTAAAAVSDTILMPPTERAEPIAKPFSMWAKKTEEGIRGCPQFFSSQ